MNSLDPYIYEKTEKIDITFSADGLEKTFVAKDNGGNGSGFYDLSDSSLNFN